MSSGPVSLHLLGKHEAISEWRQLMGPTKATKAQFEDENSIRGRLGMTDTRNAVHGSDSLQSALNEADFFFPDFSPLSWLQRELPSFLAGHVAFDPLREEHRILPDASATLTP